MRKYHLIISALLLFCALNTVHSQIENEIISFTDSTEIMVTNGRKMIWQHIQMYDNNKVAEIYDYLNEITSKKNCCAFTYNEDLFITSLINDWDGFLNHAANFSNAIRISLCYQIRDYIYSFLYKEIHENAPRLSEIAKKDNRLKDEDKELLEIFFYFLENRNDDVYDKKIKEFKKNYPHSRYKDFVKEYLPSQRLDIKTSIFIGATEIFPMGILKNHFNPSTIFNFSVEFLIKKSFMGLQVDIGSMALRKPLLSETTGYEVDFLKKDKFSYNNYGLIFGYSAIKNKQFLIAPFVYLGGVTLESNLYKNSEDNDLEFKILNSFFIGPGLRSEIKIINLNTKDPSSSLKLKIDAGYNFIVKYDYSPAKGDIFYTRFTFGCNFGDF